MSHDKCPLCKGSGKFEFPKSVEVDSVEIKRRIAVELKAKGYSIRQIMRGLNYKSPRSVSYLLAQKAN